MRSLLFLFVLCGSAFGQIRTTTTPSRILGLGGAQVSVADGNVNATPQSGGATYVTAGGLFTPTVVDFSTTVSPTVAGSGHASLAYDGTNILVSVNGGAYSILGGAAAAGALTGTTLASNVVTSSLTTVGTLAGGAVPTTLLTGTITNAQIAGSIAYSKLSLTGAILNADLAGSVDGSKISGGTFGAVNGSAVTALTAANITASTTVGRNLLNATNPSAITFPKVAADNSVSFRTPAQVLSDIGAQASGSYAASGANSDITSLTGALTAITGAGLTITGDVASGGNLTLLSTSHATKGKIYLGAGLTTAYDGVNDRFGIGTASPGSKLSIGAPTAAAQAENAAAGMILSLSTTGTPLVIESTFNSTSSSGAGIELLCNDGAALAGGDRTSAIFMGGSNSASTVKVAASMEAFAGEAWSGSVNGSYITFKTTTTGATTRAERMRIWGSGGLSVNNTTDPGAGVVSATSFTGAGTGLTGIPAAQLTGTVPDAQNTVSNSTTTTMSALGTIGGLATVTGTGAMSFTGGAGNMTITSGTGNSRTLALQTTTSGGVATNAITISATQAITLPAAVTSTSNVTGALIAASAGFSGNCYAGVFGLGTGSTSANAIFASGGNTVIRGGSVDFQVNGNGIVLPGSRIQAVGSSSSFAGLSYSGTAWTFGLADGTSGGSVAASGSFSIGGGTAILKHLSATATLDFASTAAGASTDLTITVTGAALGDTVAIGVPNGSVVANSSYSGWVSASNTVTVRFIDNALVGTADPASGTFRADVWQH